MWRNTLTVCLCVLYFVLQLQRRGSTMSSSPMPPIGRLGHYEIKGLLLCFLHIVKTLSEGQWWSMSPPHSSTFTYHTQDMTSLSLLLYWDVVYVETWLSCNTYCNIAVWEWLIVSQASPIEDTPKSTWNVYLCCLQLD